MKKIVFVGKRQQDKINGLKTPPRAVILDSNIDFSKTMSDHTAQVGFVNKLFFETDFSLEKFIKREVQNKLNGYRTQDTHNDILDISNLISYPSVVEKLVASKMKCFYCKCDVSVLYDKVRQMDQWTLDRIDNDYGHNHDNVIIACLNCNIRRKRIDSTRFKFSKECVNIKKLG